MRKTHKVFITLDDVLGHMTQDCLDSFEEMLEERFVRKHGDDSDVPEIINNPTFEVVLRERS